MKLQGRQEASLHDFASIEKDNQIIFSLYFNSILYTGFDAGKLAWHESNTLGRKTTRVYSNEMIPIPSSTEL